MNNGHLSLLDGITCLTITEYLPQLADRVQKTNYPNCTVDRVNLYTNPDTITYTPVIDCNGKKHWPNAFLPSFNCEIQQLTEPGIPLNYTTAGGFWSLALASTLTFWIIAKNFGIVLDFIRGRN